MYVPYRPPILWNPVNKQQISYSHLSPVPGRNLCLTEPYHWTKEARWRNDNPPLMSVWDWEIHRSLWLYLFNCVHLLISIFHSSVLCSQFTQHFIMSMKSTELTVVFLGLFLWIVYWLRWFTELIKANYLIKLFIVNLYIINSCVLNHILMHYSSTFCSINSARVCSQWKFQK